MQPERALAVDGLSVVFNRMHPVVRNVSLRVEAGQALGLVGESGSGKSLTLRAILGLLPPGARATGSIRYGGVSLLELSRADLQALRGSTVGMVFQDPMTALNPVQRVGSAIAQVIEAHERIGHGEALRRGVEMMERVGIRGAAQRSRAYPHQFSGGMRQRVVIAMALAARPTLLLADEPTTALDVIVQAEILRLLDRLRRRDGMTLILVSHDLGVVAGICDRVGVMYAGELVEIGETRDVLFQPRHPYTIGLISSLPEAGQRRRLPPIPGVPPDPAQLPPGCAFAARCALAIDECRSAPIPLVQTDLGHFSRCIRIDHLDEIVRSGSHGVADIGRPASI